MMVNKVMVEINKVKTKRLPCRKKKTKLYYLLHREGLYITRMHIEPAFTQNIP